MKAPESYLIHPVAHIRTGFSEKFGIPRQGCRAKNITSQIVFEPEYRNRDALRMLDGFSHLWLIWGFSEIEYNGFKPTVRPPRLGGNRRVGVFASRSPFRPNRLGLSAVKLIRIDDNAPESPVLHVAGADLLDGTPIYDIKPYLPSVDSITDAKGGYTEETSCHKLSVLFECNKPGDELLVTEITEILSEDPRPGYEDDPDTLYGLTYRGYNIRFRVRQNEATVISILKKEDCH